MNDEQVRIIDRFAGPGGWDTGLRMLGRTDVVGIEWDAAACETARANGHRRVQADIALLDPQEFVDEHLGGRAPEGGIDSPPCQGFSMAGKGLGRGDTLHVLAAVERIAAGECVDVVLKKLRALCADPRTALVLEPLRWALALRPQWLAWEQVPAVLPLWEACAQVLRAHGYSVWVQVLSAEQYGVPQTRRRACLGASRVRAVRPPVPTHSRAVSWGEALRFRGAHSLVSNYASASHPGYRNVIHEDRPAPTVTSTISRVRLVEGHIDPPRSIVGLGERITEGQAAALQSFPIGYVWHGGANERWSQIGNAVPPLLAAHVLWSIGADGRLPWLP